MCTKEKFVKLDPFQTNPLKASLFGAFNGFIILPILVSAYAVKTWIDMDAQKETTRILQTEKCTKFNFTCTTTWGCEMAPLGKKTTKLFSINGSTTLKLKPKETTNQYICSGLNEALDIAPIASINIPDKNFKCGFHYKGYGYFGTYRSGEIYKIDLVLGKILPQG